MVLQRLVVFGLLVFVALQKTRPVNAGRIGPAEPATIAAPRIVNCAESNGSITLTWLADSSNNTWEIYRAQNGEMPLLQAKIPLPQVGWWEDTAALPGNAYTYYIKALGAANGPVAWSGPAKIVLVAPELAAPEYVQFEDIQNDTLNHRIYFRWAAPIGSTLSYRILVTQGGSTYTLCRVDGLTTEYVYKYKTPLKNAVFSIISLNSYGQLSAQ